MSKELKNMTVEEYSRRLKGVNDAVLVNVIGMDSLSTFNFRKELRAKNLSLLVVKGSLAKRATEGTSLVSAFEGVSGSLAVVWGGDDLFLWRKNCRIKKPAYEKCKSRWRDGRREAFPEKLAKSNGRTGPANRPLGSTDPRPGANLLSQIMPGGLLMSQVKVGRGRSSCRLASCPFIVATKNFCPGATGAFAFSPNTLRYIVWAKSSRGCKAWAAILPPK
jgi:large subunit ribosomal protein L10